MLLKSQLIEVNSDSDFLYNRLIKLFSEIRLTQGGTALDSTLKRHAKLRNFLISKQVDKIRKVEEVYFNDDGSLKTEALQQPQKIDVVRPLSF